MTHGATLGGHVVRHAISRAGLSPEDVDDVVMGCALPEGATGWNIARQIALRAGCPVTVPGVTVNRFCSSGLQSIAIAAQRILAGEAETIVAGGVESISCVQNEMNRHMHREQWLAEHKPGIYWTMLETAETVARRYHISRERQDAYGVQSQQRAAAAQVARRFEAEIVPITVTMGVADRETSRISTREVTVASDEGLRADTTLEGIAKLKPALPGGTVSAGNASQFSDGASACVVMNASLAAQRNLQPLGVFRGFAVTGCEPEEMGIGPVTAVRRLLGRTGLAVDDIGLWELNEAFAVQVIHSRDALGIPDERLNVNGGAIAIGHPYGMSGARLAGHAMLEGARRGRHAGRAEGAPSRADRSQDRRAPRSHRQDAWRRPAARVSQRRRRRRVLGGDPARHGEAQYGRPRRPEGRFPHRHQSRRHHHRRGRHLR